MKKQKKSSAPIVILIVIIVVAGFALAAWHVMSQVNIVTKEAQKIVNMDITADDVDTTVYSDGNYAVVEATMKSYIATYLYKLREFENTINEDSFSSLLTVTNLQNDGPDFTASLNYLQSKRDNLESLTEDLSEMNSEEKIMQVWEDNSRGPFYRWIYERQMLNNITLDFYFTDAALEEAKQGMEETIDRTEGILTFLAQNQGSWTWNGDVLQFTDDALLSQYNQLISQIQG